MSSKTNFCMFNFRLLCSIKLNKQNKGFGGRNTFWRIQKGERGVTNSQNGWMVRWGRWNGCSRRLPVPVVSSNPDTQMQFFTSLSRCLQCCFLSTTLEHSFSLSLHHFWNSLCFLLSLSLSLSLCKTNPPARDVSLKHLQEKIKNSLATSLL